MAFDVAGVVVVVVVVVCCCLASPLGDNDERRQFVTVGAEANAGGDFIEFFDSIRRARSEAHHEHKSNFRTNAAAAAAAKFESSDGLRGTRPRRAAFRSHGQL